jgi:hypothetical protein
MAFKGLSKTTSHIETFLLTETKSEAGTGTEAEAETETGVAYIVKIARIIGTIGIIETTGAEAEAEIGIGIALRIKAFSSYTQLNKDSI